MFFCFVFFINLARRQGEKDTYQILNNHFIVNMRQCLHNLYKLQFILQPTTNYTL